MYQNIWPPRRDRTTSLFAGTDPFTAPFIRRFAGVLMVFVAAWTSTAALNLVGLSPATGATNICTDTVLRITFDGPPSYGKSGFIRIYTSTGTLVDTIDMSLNIDRTGSPNVQERYVAPGFSYSRRYTFPVIVSGNTATIFPHAEVLNPNESYYVNITGDVFSNASLGAFAGISDTNTWSFTTKPANPPVGTNHLIVATDGSGDFCTVQGAINFIPVGSTSRVIDIRNGVYEEIIYVEGKNDITFRGESRDGTMIQYANNNYLNTGGFYGRYLFELRASDAAIENLTLTNSTPNGGGQAEALSTKGQRFILNHAKLASYQDTLRLDNKTRCSYYYDSLIQGDTDFIWNDGVAVFQDCEIRALDDGYNCNIRTEDGLLGYKGAAFLDCSMTRANTSITGHLFNRDGTPDCFVAVINCKLDTHIAPVGWQQSATGPYLRLWEYQSTDLTGTNLVDTSSRLYLSQQITASQAAMVRNLTNYYWPNELWLPQLAPNIISQPGDVSVDPGDDATVTVKATGIETANPVNPGDPSILVPLSYQWLKNGTNFPGATNSSLTISNVISSDVGAYSVIVSNLSGVMISREATLAFIPPASPVITSPVFTNDMFSLILNGDAGENYGVQSSSNLVNWQTVFTTNAPSLPFHWIDSNAAAPNKFYRILVDP